MKKRLIEAVKRQSEIEAAARAGALEAQARSAQREIAALTRQLGEALLFNDELLSAVSKIPPITLTARKPVKGPEVSLCALFGDWHIGETIKAEEMEGFNAYNLDMARRRVDMLLEKIFRWLSVIRRGYDIAECNIVLLGDMVQGDIHQEYERTNEFPVPVQCAEAARLLAAILAEFAREFKVVWVDAIGADNHGRLSRKLQFKEAARNNYNFTVYETAKAIMSHEPRIQMRYHLPLKAQVDIGGRQVLIEHGHTTRGWMGVPFYGIERAEGKEARKRIQGHMPAFRDHWIGHWHVPAEFAGGLILNGALCGATEYDSGASRFAHASQTTFLIHPIHGVFSRIAWNLQEKG